MPFYKPKAPHTEGLFYDPDSRYFTPHQVVTIMSTSFNRSASASTAAYSVAVGLARKAVGRAYAKGGGQSGPVADSSFPGGEAWVCTTPSTFGYPSREDSLAVLVRVAE